MTSTAILWYRRDLRLHDGALYAVTDEGARHLDDVLARWDRPIGIWLLLWPVLWALWLSSEGRPDPHVFIVFVLGVVLTRSAGCVINDYADRWLDPHVERTRDGRSFDTRRVTTRVGERRVLRGG